MLQYVRRLAMSGQGELFSELNVVSAVTSSLVVNWIHYCIVFCSSDTGTHTSLTRTEGHRACCQDSDITAKPGRLAR